jgi:hypothetical protein
MSSPPDENQGADAIKKTGTHRILDMGSGAGGPWLGPLRKLRQLGVDIPVCLSDHDPKFEGLERVQTGSNQRGRSDEWHIDHAFSLILGKLGGYPASAL